MGKQRTDTVNHALAHDPETRRAYRENATTRGSSEKKAAVAAFIAACCAAAILAASKL